MSDKLFSRKQSKEIIGIENQITAVTKNGNNIRFIDNPSEQIQLLAVKHRGTAIQYIHKPSKTVQLEAIKNNKRALKIL